MNQINDMPLVSIVTPAYNAERFIDEMLNSVKYQTYPSIEHVVADDGSTDNTALILRKHEETYNLKWFSKPNEGQAVTLNRCIELAHGELVVLLNADDVLFDAEVIANLVGYFKTNREVDVAYGHLAIIDERNRLLKIWYTIPWFNYDRLLQAHFAYFICYRRGVLNKYRFDPALDFVMDYEQCLRMAKDGVKFGCLNSILLAYRRHEATKSVSRRRDQLAETREVQGRYGRRLGFYQLSMSLLDSLVLLCFKFCGLITVIKLYSHPEEFRLAFPIRFGSLLRTIVGQLVPFTYVNLGGVVFSRMEGNPVQTAAQAHGCP